MNQLLVSLFMLLLCVTGCTTRTEEKFSGIVKFEGAAFRLKKELASNVLEHKDETSIRSVYLFSGLGVSFEIVTPRLTSYEGITLHTTNQGFQAGLFVDSMETKTTKMPLEGRLTYKHPSGRVFTVEAETADHQNSVEGKFFTDTDWDWNPLLVLRLIFYVLAERGGSQVY